MSLIIVDVYNDFAILSYGNFKTKAYIGLNGVTSDKKEGDKATPLGKFQLGISFGTDKLCDTLLEYIPINSNLYWVDDVNSDYYNQLVNIKNVKKDWCSAEHLIEYPEEYKYAVEIKTNKENIKGRGSAIFLHCQGKNKYTYGCIAIPKDDMKYLLSKIDSKTSILIRKGE